MPYDPQWPQNGQVVDADRFRGQFSGLKDLIDALNVILAAQVDGVTTVNPGDPAQASVSIIDNTLHFSFSIPKGNDGGQGSTGDTGAQGPPFAQAIIDAVNTLNPGESATAQVGFDGTNVHFTFSIPRGNDGGQGIQGEQGIQGQPGTNAPNSNAVSTLGQSADSSYNQAQIQALHDKMDELILALRA